MSGEEEALIDSPAGLQQYLAGTVRYPGVHPRRLSNGGLEMSVVVKGTVYGTTQELEMAVDPQGRQIYAPGEMGYTELTRQGGGWSSMSTTAFAALVARPTTTAGVELFNGNAIGSGICMVVDRLFAEWRLATAVASNAIMYAMVGPQTAPTAGAFTIRGNSGKAYNGFVTTSVNQTVTDNGWFVWGGPMSAALAAATPNGGIDSRVEGRLIVPPGHALCLHVVASVTGDTFVQGASWYEKYFNPTLNPLL